MARVMLERTATQHTNNSTKSPLTAKVDDAMTAWRKWKFG